MQGDKLPAVTVLSMSVLHTPSLPRKLIKALLHCLRASASLWVSGFLSHMNCDDYIGDNRTDQNCVRSWWCWGTRVAQSVKCLTLAQVMIPRFMGLSSTSGSLLSACQRRAWSLLQILCLPLSLSPSPIRALSLFLSLKNE